MRDYLNVSKRWGVIAIVAVLLILAFLLVSSGKNKNTDTVIIFSPHYDDAVLSLGGLLSVRNSNTTVITFFTGAPEPKVMGDWDKISGFEDSTSALISRKNENLVALKSSVQKIDLGYVDSQYRKSTENIEDLELNITKDIQNIITSYGTTTKLVVYGPAIFSEDINNPDHKIVHEAFVQAIQDFPQSNVTFRFYEDFPYIERFNKESVISVKKNIENETGFLVKEEKIMLRASDVNSKVGAIGKYTSQVKAFSAQGIDILKQAEQYTSKRCIVGGSPKPCEVAYEVFVVKE